MARIGIFAYENCTSSIVLGMLDVFSFANQEWCREHETEAVEAPPLLDVRILSADGRKVHSFNRHPIIPDSEPGDGHDFDLLIIPGCLGDLPEIIRAEQSSVAWLREQHTKGVCLSAVCTGNFLLAETGLLTEREATTHWSCVSLFRQRYPRVRLKPARILIDAGDILSAAGVTAYLNLCIHLVAKYGTADLASYCSKVFLIDSGRDSQAPYEVCNFSKSSGDREITKAQEWLASHFTDSKVSVESMATIAGLERRTFLRRFKSATGESPLVYLQRVRVDSAKRKLESTRDSVSEITWSVGYQDVSSFQRLFKSYTGLSPGAYRKKFSMR